MCLSVCLGIPETPQGDQQETKGCAGGLHYFGDTKGMFVYDLVAQFCTVLPCGIVRTKQDTFSNLQDTIGIIICVSIHLIRHRKPIEVALTAFRYNHIKAKIKSLISLPITLYTHNIQTFYLFLIGTQVTLFSKKANWHAIRNRVVKVIYVCMCPA